MTPANQQYVRDTLKELWSVMADWLPDDEKGALEDDYNECMIILEGDD